MLIARTETIRASNAGAEESYKQSGVVTSKEWLVTADDRLCPACAEMDGEIIELGENYYNKGDEMSFGSGDEQGTLVFDYGAVAHPPLHPNCRCTLVPVVDMSVFSEEELAVMPEQDAMVGILTKLPVLKGGPGSGNFDHEGRPGQVGGSGEGGEGVGDLKKFESSTHDEEARKIFTDNFAKNVPKEYDAKDLQRRFDNIYMSWVLGQPHMGAGPETLEYMTKYFQTGKVPSFAEYEKTGDEAIDKRDYAILVAGAKATVDTTRELLKDRGVDSVKVYRGMTPDQSLRDGFSFWSTDKTFAQAFAGNSGRVVSTTISTKDIVYHNSTNPAVREYYTKVRGGNYKGAENSDELLVRYTSKNKLIEEGKGYTVPWADTRKRRKGFTNEEIAEGLLHKFSLIIPLIGEDENDKKKRYGLPLYIKVDKWKREIIY
jgi:hypothetical protein